MEVGAKVRFLQETERRPQVGTFVILDLPTGNSSRGLGEGLAVGVETFHTTPSTGDNVPETRFNVGAVIDLSKTQHILWSAGRGIQGPNRFQTYVAVQLTL